MALIVKYKFQNVDADGNSISLLPQFPSGVSYTKTDVVEGNITTRIIETDDLSKITYIRFGCNEDTYVTGAWEYLTEILDINVSYVNTFYKMFRGCKILNKLDVSNWDISKVTNLQATFQECQSLTSLDVSNWNTSNVTNMHRMFNNCKSLTSLDVSKWNTSKVTNMSYMFYECRLLTSLDVSKWDTSKVTSLQSTFYNCAKLTTLDVSKWDTSKVTNLYVTFYRCSNLTTLDVSGWDTSNVTNFQSTFNDCSALTTLDVSGWDTSKANTLRSIFNGCSALTTLDVSGWDTSNVTDLQSTFNDCSALTTLDVSGWDTSNVTDMTNTFNNCRVKNVGLIYCSEDTIDKLANCITSPCDFYVTNKTYTSPNPLVKYVMYREDKKPLLYYNNETQTWEKPILREWDSIEKHSDGKYYYHKRSEEVVLNGSEDWTKDNGDNLGYSIFYIYGAIGKKNGICLSDRFKYSPQSYANIAEECIKLNNTGVLCILINDTKLSTQDKIGFKTWLQANPTTVVYQLAEEKVYECTNLDLITYANETNLLVKSGVIAPKTTLKIHQNITNIITILQNKVSVLENVFIQGLKQVLAGDMQSLAYMLYPEDFENIEQQNDPTDE